MTLRSRVTASAVVLVLLAGLGAAGVSFLAEGSPEAIPTFTVRRQDFAVEVEGEGTLEAVRATPLAMPRSVRGALRIAWLAPDGSRVEAGDPVVRFDPSDMERKMREARDELELIELEIAKARIEGSTEVENLHRDAELAAAELDAAERFQKKDALIYSRQEIIESELDEHLARRRQQHAEQERETRKVLSQAELDLLAIERRQARLKIEEAREALDALEITAPHDGIVVLRRDGRGNMPRVGDTVFSGNPIAEIPDLTEMQAEIHVLEADAGDLAPGQPGEVVVDAHPETVYPAELTWIDSLAKPRRRGSPVQYFAVTLTLERTDPERMKPGQRVRATLIPARVENALVVPRQAVFGRQDERVVYRREGNAFRAVPVTLGVAGIGRAVVTEGLAPGDVIALRDPSRAPAGLERGGGGPEPGGPPMPREGRS